VIVMAPLNPPEDESAAPVTAPRETPTVVCMGDTYDRGLPGSPRAGGQPAASAFHPNPLMTRRGRRPGHVAFGNSLRQASPPLTRFYVAVGGGRLRSAAHCRLVKRRLGPKVEIIGVEPGGCRRHDDSLGRRQAVVCLEQCGFVRRRRGGAKLGVSHLLSWPQRYVTAHGDR